MSEIKRKVTHDLTAFRVAIPTVLVARMGWESCKYVMIEDVGSDMLIIRRCKDGEVDTKSKA